VAGQPHVQRLQYAVCFPKGSACVSRSEITDPHARISGALRSKDLFDNGTYQPIASNIVNMKLQYGIDKGDGKLTWIGPGMQEFADNWGPDAMKAASWKKISSIKAIRIGLVVSSSQYDREVVKPYTWVLFNCADGDSTCSGTIDPDQGGGGFRYRVYETVVPLRNSLWNRQL
jgi:hypothetical protein